MAALIQRAHYQLLRSSARSGIGIGLFLLLSGAGTIGAVLGLWAVGVGVNYVPLVFILFAVKKPA